MKKHNRDLPTKITDIEPILDGESNREFNIHTKFQEIHIFVSPTGRSIRAWLNGKKLVGVKG